MSTLNIQPLPTGVSFDPEVSDSIDLDAWKQTPALIGEQITLSTENEWMIAEYENWDVVGDGTHLSAALLDLQDTIVELFLTLCEDREPLGGDLPELLMSMEQRIEKR